MSDASDRLQGVFRQLARASLTSSGSQAASGESSLNPIASNLSQAGQAYQLNPVTESRSGFSMFGGGFGSGLGGLLGRGMEGLGGLLGEAGSGAGGAAATGEPGAAAPRVAAGAGAAGCQLDAQTLADLDKFTLRLVDDYRNGLTNIQNNAATSASARRDAVAPVWTWVRANLPGTRLMRSIAHSNLTDAEKQRHLGWFAIQVLRVEFLLGWIQMGGLNQASLPTWERQAPDNLDEFYTSDEGMGGGDSDWCTRFAGYGRKRTGFTPGLITGLMFNSGYRLYEWAVHDRTHDHRDWTGVLGIAGNSNDGVLVIQRGDFRNLTTTLNSSSNIGNDIDSFFNTQGMTPQCGDILVTGRSGNNWKNASFNSHTVAVEEYDAASRVIYTLEGNAGNSRCVGKKIDLTDTAETGKLLYLVRPGHQQHLGAAPAPGCTLTQSQINDLRTGVGNYVSELATVAINLNYLKTTGNTDRVYTWYTGNAA
jgi:hypothetical protein